MISDNYFAKYFNKGCAELTMYYTRHECLEITDEYICSDDFCLGRWIKEVRSAWNNNELSEKQIRKLELLGLAQYPKEQTWEEMYKRAAEFYDVNHIEHCDSGEADAVEKSETEIPVNYKTEDGILLGAWVDRQRKLCLSGSLSKEKERRLIEIGIVGRKNDVNSPI